jgi:uncharacterized membrane protein YoaK (UPF0700 family)
VTTAPVTTESRPPPAPQERTPHDKLILLATAFAAGTVDIIGFAQLGGVFASAMTGNFALLAYHVAQGNSRSAVGSSIALAGFLLGCSGGFALHRGRPQRRTLGLLLAGEMGLLLGFAIYALPGSHPATVLAARLQILLLAVAMGLQAVIGQASSLSTIVFTTTLTRLVGGISDYFANVPSPAVKNVRIQSAVVVSYLSGALLAGVMAVHQIDAIVFLPLAGVTLAFIAHLKGQL